MWVLVCVFFYFISSFDLMLAVDCSNNLTRQFSFSFSRFPLCVDLIYQFVKWMKEIFYTASECKPRDRWTHRTIKRKCPNFQAFRTKKSEKHKRMTDSIINSDDCAYALQWRWLRNYYGCLDIFKRKAAFHLKFIFFSSLEKR